MLQILAKEYQHWNCVTCEMNTAEMLTQNNTVWYSKVANSPHATRKEKPGGVRMVILSLDDNLAMIG